MKSVIEWAIQLRHTSADYPLELRKAIDDHNERIIDLVRAEGFRAGQESMRARASKVCPDRTDHEWVRDSLWDRIAQRMGRLIAELSIEEPKAG